MKRAEILSVFYELLANFGSMQGAPIVSLSKLGDSPDWELQIRWLAAETEKNFLDDFALKHGLKFREEHESTFFH
jgi:hypothetical protein